MKIKWVIFYGADGSRTVLADSPEGKKYIAAVLPSLVATLKRHGRFDSVAGLADYES